MPATSVQRMRTQGFYSSGVRGARMGAVITEHKKAWLREAKVECTALDRYMYFFQTSCITS